MDDSNDMKSPLSTSGANLMRAANRRRSLMASKSKEKVANLAPIPPFGASDAEIKEYERRIQPGWMKESLRRM